MAKINLGKVVDKEEWELIEAITCDGTETVIKRTGLNLLKMEMFIEATATTSNGSYAIEVKNKYALFGYAWVGNGIGANAQKMNLSAESGNKPFATFQRSTNSASATTSTVLYGLQSFKDGSTPIDSFSVCVNGCAVFPEGTTVTIYGVRA